MSHREKRRLRLWGAILSSLSLATFASCSRQPTTPDTLVVLNERDVEGLDPHTSGELWHTQTVLANMYETLSGFDPRMALVPILAESWSNPDDLTWDFRIRRGVPFQTGGTLDAKDVVYSLLRARDDPGSVLKAALAGVEEIGSPGPGSVRIKTRQPDLLLVTRLREVFIVSKRFVTKHDPGAVASASCGTGPYRLAAHVPGKGVDLARFEGYWKGPAPIPKASFVARSFGEKGADSFVDPRSRALFWVNPALPAFERAKKEFALLAAPSLTTTYLSWDLASEAPPGVRLPAGASGNPFRDARVRQAIALAIDKRRLARGGAEFPASQMVPAVIFGFDPSIEVSEPDPARAAALLLATPYRKGFEVEVDLRKSQQQYAPSMVEDLGAIGIRLRPNILSESEFFEKLKSGRSSLYVLRFFCRSGDAQELFDKWVHSRDEARGFGEANYSYRKNPVPGLDEQIDAARRELQPSLRTAAMKEIMREVMAAQLAVPLL